MTSRQLAGWLAFMRVEPFGGARDDRRFGELWALTANVNRDTSKRRKPFVWHDLFTEHGHDMSHDVVATQARRDFEQAMAMGSSLGFSRKR